MQRDASIHLDDWLARRRRLPLVVRGARQVGKTWLVRDLASRHGLDLVECNFERTPELARCFDAKEPRKVLGELSLALGRNVEEGNSLLFLDEIQAAGDTLAGLRWFAEEMPELPVVAAGSLLEFTLAEHGFSMPVGRVTYLHLEPLTFPEFLAAHGQRKLLDTLQSWVPGTTMGAVAHDRAGVWFARYTMVGGMPAVVQADVESDDARDVRRLQHDLVATYRDDFGKYAGRMNPTVLDAVLRSVALQLGSKFVYSHVSNDVRHRNAKAALELLARARVCHIVEHTAANGIPLGGEVKARSRKVILLDTGLAQALLGVPASLVFPAWDSLAAALRGALTEQLVGQQLRTLFSSWEEPRLYYWQRMGGRPGEVDFLTQVDSQIVPIEVKAGAAGSLKSLHQFMHDKRLEVAVRCDTNPPSAQDVDVATTQGDPAQYRLVSLPHYLVWRVRDAVRSA